MGHIKLRHDNHKRLCLPLPSNLIKSNLFVGDHRDEMGSYIMGKHKNYFASHAPIMVWSSSYCVYVCM